MNVLLVKKEIFNNELITIAIKLAKFFQISHVLFTKNISMPYSLLILILIIFNIYNFYSGE